MRSATPATVILSALTLLATAAHADDIIDTVTVGWRHAASDRLASRP